MINIKAQQMPKVDLNGQNIALKNIKILSGVSESYLA